MPGRSKSIAKLIQFYIYKAEQISHGYIYTDIYMPRQVAAVCCQLS